MRGDTGYTKDVMHCLNHPLYIKTQCCVTRTVYDLFTPYPLSAAQNFTAPTVLVGYVFGYCSCRPQQSSLVSGELSPFLHFGFE